MGTVTRFTLNHAGNMLSHSDISIDVNTDFLLHRWLEKAFVEKQEVRIKVGNVAMPMLVTGVLK